MLTDEQLASAIAHGSGDALTTLVERHHNALVGYLYRVTGGDRALAQDLTQETFLRLLRTISHYEYPRPFKPWLYAIATNLARDHYKRADTQHTFDDIDDTLPFADHEPAQLEDSLFMDAEMRRTARALNDLPDFQREVVTLRYQQELSLAEIAEALNIPVGTVKSRLSIGLRRLRDLLEQEPNHYEYQQNDR